MPQILFIALVVVATTLLSLSLTAYLIPRLKARQLIDSPNERTLHKGDVPRGGGLVFVLTLIVACLVLAASTDLTSFFMGIAAIATLWATMGFSDDVFNLKPSYRLVFQIIFAVLATLLFGWVDEVFMSSSLSLHLGKIGLILTIVGTVWMANLYNFMDGMDGMAASQAVIASLNMSIWFFAAGSTELALLCLVLTCSVYGFLWHNWQPAKVFMGDVGSVTLGAVFALLIVIADNRFGIPALASLMIFAVFITDTTITLVKRIIRREAVWQAHREHLYQRLATRGFSHVYIVVGYIIVMLLSSLIATFALKNREVLWIYFIALFLGLAIVNTTINRLVLSKANTR